MSVLNWNLIAWSFYLPIAPIKLGSQIRLQIDCLVLSQSCTQKLSSAFKQRQNHFTKSDELVGFAFLWR